MLSVIPVFRVFDYAKTIEFYIDWLGFEIKWEHRPENSPFYMQLAIRDVPIELSEHHGDCTPGSCVSLVNFEGLEAYHQWLMKKDYKFMKPGLRKVEWKPNTLELVVIDPFFNRIIFNEDL